MNTANMAAEILVSVETVPVSGAFRVSTFAPDGVRETVTVYGVEEGDDTAGELAHAVARLVRRVHGVELARDAYRVPGYFFPAAYWVAGSVLLCADCVDDETRALGDSDHGGAEVLPVLAGGETDTPSTCESCGVLVAEDLTPHGVECVRELAGDSGPVSAAVLLAVLDAYGWALEG